MKNDLLKKAVFIERSTPVLKYPYRYLVWETKLMSYRVIMSTLQNDMV